MKILLSRIGREQSEEKALTASSFASESPTVML